MVRRTKSPGLPARGRHAPANEVVRVGPLMGLAALVRDLGSDPDPIFASAGFNPGQFADPDVEIPFVLGSRLLAHCVTATGCEPSVCCWVSGRLRPPSGSRRSCYNPPPGMHERTINRRLREEGTTFRRELEDIRYEVARQLLTDTMMPLSKVAAALDYADTTAFIRAFKRWSGIPPAEWRRFHGCS